MTPARGRRWTGIPIRAVAVLLAVVLCGDVSLDGQLLWRRRERVDVSRVRADMEFLASDALSGRASGSRDEWIAATYIASQLLQAGLEPAGDADGYLQTIITPPRPARRGGAPGGVPPGGAPAPPGEFGRTWNVVGRIRGRDPAGASEAILLSAHLDHVGVRGAGPDTIFNGADDDASGVSAVLEIARLLASRRLPRTVIVAFFGSEEAGGLGSRHFADHPPIPLTSIVANLQFEMIGRPDPAVPAGVLWLTGFDRSTLGPELARRGARLVLDPHPEQKFFMRSDNYQLALRGVVAHTVSSYGLHPEYHTPADDLSRIDFTHMTGAIQSMVEPIAWLAGSRFRPVWLPGMQPERR